MVSLKKLLVAIQLESMNTDRNKKCKIILHFLTFFHCDNVKTGIHNVMMALEKK